MRDLFIIPIIHSTSDLGQLRDPIEEIKNGLMDSRAVQASRTGVDRFWQELRQGIEGWKLDYSQLQVYQDALPVGPNPADHIERKIIRELAAKGSVNHQLVQWLTDQGATTMGTESPDLLLQEYAMVRKTLDRYLNDEDGDLEDADELSAQQHRLLNRRDAFIADRIEKTLPVGKTGLIFLGMLHQLDAHLSSEIRVLYPFGKPSTDHVKFA